MNYLTNPGGNLKGSIRVPGDKSISHRAVMLAAIAEGTTEVSGLLEGDDVLATIAAFRAMGVSIEQQKPAHVVIHGVGLRGLRAATHDIDCGNSGTTIRLLTGLLAGQPFKSRLTGDNSLKKRPMLRVVQPLEMMGANINTSENKPPVTIYPVKTLHGIRYRLPIASAQVKSALLLASLYAEDETVLLEPIATRDHTERMLQAFHYPIATQAKKIQIKKGGELSATTITIPADISSAAFFMVGASIAPGSEILLTDVGINPTRTGIIEILKRMGADITLQNLRVYGNEPVADIVVRYAPLKGIVIPSEFVASAIDEFPILFIAAANARGETVLTGAQELRVKESDRIQVMAEGLQKIGVNAQPIHDGMKIQGGAYHGGKIDSHGDHRIAMSFAMAGLTATESIQIFDWDNVATSFPGFSELAVVAGLRGELQIK